MSSPYAMMKGDQEIPEHIVRSKIEGGKHIRMTCDSCTIEYTVFYFEGEEELVGQLHTTINKDCGHHSERLATIKQVSWQRTTV